MRWDLVLLLTSCIYILSCSGENKTNGPSNNQQATDSIAIWIKASSKKEFSKQEKSNLLQKAFAAVKKSPDTKLKTNYLSEISLACNSKTDAVLFRAVTKELIRTAIAITDYTSHGFAHWDLGFFLRRSQPDSAIYHYKEAYQLFLKVDLDPASISFPGRILYAMAIVKNNNKDYIGAEKDIVNAIKYFTQKNLNDWLFSAYNVLASIQNGLGKFDKALEYHQKAKEFIPYSKESQQYTQNTININNRAFANLRKEDYVEAIALYNVLLQTDSLFFKSAKLYAKAISGLAYAKFKNGATDYAALTQEFIKSNNILDSLGITYDKARNYEYKAEVLHKASNTGLAITNALLAKEIAEQTTNNDRLLSSLKLLTTIDKGNSDSYAAAYYTLNEELQIQERAIQDKFARIELETDEIIQKNESLAKQRKTLLAVAIGILILGLVVFIIISQRANNQKLRFEKTQQESNQEIYSLMLSQQGKIQEGKQLEQKRISEEIHDGILGQMLGIRLILTGLNNRSDDASIAQRAELIEKLRELEEEMRTISHELHSASYEKVTNFIIAIQDLITTVSSSSKINVQLEFTDTFDWDQLDGDIKINTYRITQECLQNCVKHAKAKNITVLLESDYNNIFLKVIDDGVGFNVKKGKKGIGLRNISSRIEKINGKLDIKSTRGKGTEIIINVSLNNVDNNITKQHPLEKKIVEV